jgi:hypothetical protein
MSVDRPPESPLYMHLDFDRPKGIMGVTKHFQDLPPKNSMP